MLFNSLEFAVFFLVVYAAYLLLPHRGQNILLLIASYVFYGSWDWRFLSLLLISTLTDYIIALAIDASESARRRKVLVVISMCVSLTLLGFFKYFNFFVENLEHLLNGLGFATGGWRLRIILPIGISFYTFQTINYTIDVYRRHMKPTRKLLDFAVFVGFFPHLVAGPIMRASSLLPQVERPRTVTWEGIRVGTWLFFWGLFKKVVIADNLAGIVDHAFGGGVAWCLGSVYASLLAFAFQIYCDFSGYSDMARGLAKWMGFELIVNFNNPYVATNPSDFWRRWHISLSTWLRDYLYIPLGGNRLGPVRTYVNLSLTMLLGGLWHGAAWTYVCWGAYQGLLLVVHRLIAGHRKHEPPADARWVEILKRMAFFQAVLFGWLLFRAQSMGQVGHMLRAVVSNPVLGESTGNWLLTIVILCTPMWIVQHLQVRSGNLDAPLHLSLAPRTLLYAALLVMMISFGNNGGHAFIYFQF